MATANGDRNLLFGILALQMDFIRRDALVRAMNAWVLDKGKSLGQILVEQGALRADAHALLDALVHKHLQMHGGDPEKSLAAISSNRSVREELRGIADPDVQASLAHVPAARPSSADPYATEAPSVGASSAEGRRFRILRPHAEGGLGKVSVAHDEELHREVALKEILERHADHPESRSRFLVEAEITGGLEHPGIVPVYGLGQYADGRPFYAMRFIRGDSLKEAIERYHKPETKRRPAGERALALRQLLGRFVDVCEAIAYAHSRGVLHRDLKPGNIMLGKYGETLVVDWGLAKPVGGPAEKQGAAEEPLRPTSVNESAPTQMGATVGTPAFMPPEQAAGRLDQLVPASDVYSLGATLYCLLTGKAPFEGGDVGEVLRRVQRGDFPRPRQVNRDVHPALEAVCLKAMALRPEHRYPTPRALAADVEKWLADEPVGAWREPWRVRLGRWTRRHQTMVAAVAAGVMVAILASGAGAWWLERQGAERRQAVEAALSEVERLQGEARWNEARAVLGQAKQRLGDDGPGDLKGKLDRAQGEIDLVERLEAVRLKKATLLSANGNADWAGADQDYEAAFATAGMPEVGGDAAAAAAWVHGSRIRENLVAALDDWATCAKERGRWTWLLEVARRADPDPWRDRARDPAVRDDPAALARLVGEKEAAKQSPQLLVGMCMRLADQGGRVEGPLRGAQQQHPGDFWVNFDMGNALEEAKKPEEAVGYYRAALAVRPGTVAVYNNLGIVLRDQGKLEEAAAECSKAVALDPNSALAHCNLGVVLWDQRQRKEAAAEYRRAIELNPNLAIAHYDLGNVLRDQGKLEEAAAECRKAVELDPTLAMPHNGLGNILYRQGQREAAAAEYQKAVELDPKLAAAYTGLGNVLRDEGRREEAAAKYHRAIELNPKDAGAHATLGNVLYDQGRREEAAVEFRKAIELDPKFAQAHIDLGNVLYAQGRREEAAAEYRKAVELNPTDALVHTNLGSALNNQGRREEAAAEFRKAIELDPGEALARIGLGAVLGQQGKWEDAVDEFRRAIELNPKDAKAHTGLGVVLVAQDRREEAAAEYRRAIELDPKDATAHYGLGRTLLQNGQFSEARQATQRCLELLPSDNPFRKAASEQLRQCEQKLALDKKLTAILKGEARPTDAAEQVSLAELCSLRNRHAAAARFYADAFAAKPALADDVQTGNRYNAACAAALAGAGQGDGADKLDDTERARLRKEALGWLRADLAQWGKQTESGTPQERANVQKTIQHWQEDTDLAGVRDAAALEKLPESERADWKKLWADVDALLKKSGDGGQK